MQTDYHTIYLSPHLDDAALSCGGQIYQQTQRGERVLIVTVMAGDPPVDAVSQYAESLQKRWELLTDAVAARRAEDMAACRIMGTDWLHWQVADCIYRLHPDTGTALYLSDHDIFGAVHPAELTLVDLLARQLTTLPPHDRLIAPLTVGHHVDHLLTRMAAEESLGQGLWYYEDYPYAQQPGKLAAVLQREEGDWCAEVIPLTADALRAKFDAVAAFRSQLSTFWQDRAVLEQEIGGYAAAVGGERLWRRAEASC